MATDRIRSSAVMCEVGSENQKRELEEESPCVANADTQTADVGDVSLNDRKYFHQVRHSSCFVQCVFVTLLTIQVYIPF